jgi:hypothetical protein
MTDETRPRWYGVSYGDGNDGVSQLFPDFYVRTAHPWDLARAAAVSAVAPAYQAWAAAEVQVDGEADYTLHATLLEGPDGETAYGAAWFICEVFPVEGDEMRDEPSRFDGLAAAFAPMPGVAIPDEPKEPTTTAGSRSARRCGPPCGRPTGRLP